jgi:hypothetical protein
MNILLIFIGSTKNRNKNPIFMKNRERVDFVKKGVRKNMFAIFQEKGKKG